MVTKITKFDGTYWRRSEKRCNRCHLWVQLLPYLRQRSCLKVMFSVLSVCQSVCSQGVSMWSLDLMPLVIHMGACPWTCSNFFTWGLPSSSPCHPHWDSPGAVPLRHVQTCSICSVHICRKAVGNQLKYLLVWYCVHFTFYMGQGWDLLCPLLCCRRFLPIPRSLFPSVWLHHEGELLFEY